jgi:hypothetical protein
MNSVTAGLLVGVYLAAIFGSVFAVLFISDLIRDLFNFIRSKHGRIDQGEQPGGVTSTL